MTRFSGRFALALFATGLSCVLGACAYQSPTGPLPANPLEGKWQLERLQCGERGDPLLSEGYGADRLKYFNAALQSKRYFMLLTVTGLRLETEQRFFPEVDSPKSCLRKKVSMLAKIPVTSLDIASERLVDINDETTNSDKERCPEETRDQIPRSNPFLLSNERELRIFRDQSPQNLCIPGQVLISTFSRVL